MPHQQATAAVKRITEYTIDFLASKHGVTSSQIVAGLVAGDAKLVEQWNTCFALAAEQVK